MTEEIALPEWDEQVLAWLVKETDEWLVHVRPMIFNDRILFSRRTEYPLVYSRGWCYDQGGSAVLAAMAWDPDQDPEPVGYKKAVGSA